MSWDQGYCVPPITTLCKTLLNQTEEEIFISVLKSKGIEIVKRETIDIEGASAERLYLNDGRIFEPRLVERVSGDDWGTDIYEYREINEKIRVNRKRYE